MSFLASLALSVVACANYRATYDGGTAARRDGQWAKADELFASIPEKSEVYADALAGRAEVASAQGQYEKAVQFWKQAAKVAPDSYGKEKNRGYHRDFANLLIKSQFEVPGPARSLFVAEELVIAHIQPSTLVAFDLKTQKQAWSHPIEKIADAEWSRRVFAGGAIIGLDEVKTNERPARLVAIDPKTGTERWVLPIYPIASEMHIGANDTYVFHSNRIRGSQNYEINAYDAKTGKPKWARPIDGRSGPLAVTQGGVFVWTSNTSIMGFRADDGAPLFSLPMPIEQRQDQLVADDKRVFLVGGDGNAYAFDASDKKYEPPTNRILWKSPIEKNCGGQHAEAAVVEGKLIVPCKDSVVSFDAETGKQQWKRSLEQDMGSGGKVTPKLIGGLVLVKYGASLVALGPSNGDITWMYDAVGTSDLTPARPVEYNGQILVGASSGKDKKSKVLSLTLAPAVTY